MFFFNNINIKFNYFFNYFLIIKNTHCKEIGCKVKNVTYGLINTKIWLFCATHGKNKTGMVDVVNPICKK